MHLFIVPDIFQFVILLPGSGVALPQFDRSDVVLPSSAAHGGQFSQPLRQPSFQEESLPWAAGGSGIFGQFFRPHTSLSVPARPVVQGPSGGSARDPRRRSAASKPKG